MLTKIFILWATPRLGAYCQGISFRKVHGFHRNLVHFSCKLGRTAYGTEGIFRP